MMKKLTSKFAPIALALTMFPLGIVSAQGGVGAGNLPPTIDIPSIVLRVMNWAFGLLIVLAAAFIFFAAYLYLTAGTQPDNVGKAKQYIIYAVVAIVVGFVARGLVSIVTGLLQ